MNRRSARSKLVTLLLAVGTTACATDLETRHEDLRQDPPPVLVSRTGVPILMDLPVIGFLFGRTTIVR